MNVARLVKLHQEKCHHEANRSPFQTPEDGLAHSLTILALLPAAFNKRPKNELSIYACFCF